MSKQTCSNRLLQFCFPAPDFFLFFFFLSRILEIRYVSLDQNSGPQVKNIFDVKITYSFCLTLKKFFMIQLSHYFLIFVTKRTYVICSSFKRKSPTGCWLLFLRSILLIKPWFSVLVLCNLWLFDALLLLFLLLAVLWLLVFEAGTSWLCFPSYVVMTALGSDDALSTCFLTLQPGVVHL